MSLMGPSDPRGGPLGRCMRSRKAQHRDRSKRHTTGKRDSLSVVNPTTTTAAAAAGAAAGGAANAAAASERPRLGVCLLPSEPSDNREILYRER